MRIIWDFFKNNHEFNCLWNKTYFSIIIFLIFQLKFYTEITKNSIVYLFVFVKYLFHLFNGFVEKISNRNFRNKSSLVQNALVQST